MISSVLGFLGLGTKENEICDKPLHTGNCEKFSHFRYWVEKCLETSRKPVLDDDARINLLGNVRKNMEIGELRALLKDSWEINPDDTMKILFYIRDYKNGFGERKIFQDGLMYVLTSLYYTDSKIQYIMSFIPLCGTFKDLFCFFGTKFEPQMINFYTKQLLRDLEAYNDNRLTDVSLAAKYAPTEHCHYDKKYHAVAKFCRALKMDKGKYRKLIISPLRKYLSITERKMSLGEWKNINLTQVPQIAREKYHYAWSNHKVHEHSNAKNPYTSPPLGSEMEVCEIAEQYFRRITISGNTVWLRTDLPSIDWIVETQWTEFLKHTQRNLDNAGKKLRTLCAVDISDSMQSQMWQTDFRGFPQTPREPIRVAVPLAIALDSLSTVSSFSGKVIVGLHPPDFRYLNGSFLLRDKILKIAQSEGLFRLFIRCANVLDKLLVSAIASNVEPNNMPDTVLLLTNVPPNTSNISLENMKELYERAGYTLPKTVYWCMHIPAGFPSIIEKDGVTVIEGVHPELIKMVLEGRELSSKELMTSLIANEKYNFTEKVNFSNYF